MKKVIAHRGFSGRYPENTMLAFRKAIEIGAEGAEFDVQLTRDNIPVIFHDEDLSRVAGYKVFVKDLTYRELSRYDVSYKWRDQIAPQHVPTLAEYFELVRDLDFLSNIELKTAIFEYPGIEQIVIDLIRDYDLSDRVILSSFNHYSLLRCKEIAPEIPCGILYECRLAEPQEYAARLGMEYLHPWHIFLSDAELDKYDAAGIKVNAWTVDHAEDMRYLLQKNCVTGIMSNFPDLLLYQKKELLGE